MENLTIMKKFKAIISCCVVAFVAMFVLAVVSFVQVGKVRRTNAEYEKKIEQALSQESALKNEIDSLEKEAGEGSSDNIIGDYEIEVAE